MFEKLKALAEKLMIATITRGLLWFVGLLAAKFAFEAPDEATVKELGVKIGTAVVAIVIALIWSKKKDAANIAADPK